MPPEKQPSRLQIIIPNVGRTLVGDFSTIEEARIERDRICKLHGFKRRIKEPRDNYRTK